MTARTKNIFNLAFFGAYAALMLYEGVIKELGSATNWQWLALFVLGAAVTYWAHRRNGIITIALLFLHTTLELMHHGSEFALLAISAIIVFAIHLLFDCGFLWSEIKHHAKSPIAVFGTMVFFYAVIFISSMSFGATHAEAIESTEFFSSAITGGILACVVAHGLSLIKKVRK